LRVAARRRIVATMRYADRTAAGHALAGNLGHQEPAVVVLALPRGGVPVAVPVAASLDAELDVLVIRKLGVPWQPELAMGAIGPGGVRVLQQDVIAGARVAPAEIERAARLQAVECERQEKLYRAGRPPLDLAGRTAVLVDDGLATGASMLAAIRVARALGADKIIAAAPVGATDTIRRLGVEADEVVVDQAVRTFRAVGNYYDNFRQVSDDEVLRLLRR